MSRAALVSILFALGSSPSLSFSEGPVSVVESSNKASSETTIATPLDRARELIKQWSSCQRYAERCVFRDELVSLGPDAATALFEAHRLRIMENTPDTEEFIVGTLRKIGLAAVPSMIAELERNDCWGAHMIGLSLREFEGDALETIIKQSSSSNPVLRKNIIRVVSHMGGDDERVIAVVARASKDETVEVRREAAYASIRKSPEVLRVLLHDPEKEVRAGALDAVRVLGKEANSLIDELLEILANEKEDSFVRGQAAYALGWCALEPGKVVSALKRALAEKELAREAADSLFRLASYAESAIPDLIKVIDEYDWYQGDAAAVEALAAIGDASINPLIDVLGHEPKRARFAAMALAKIKSPRVKSAVPALVACLNRNRFENEVARELIWALEGIAPDDVKVIDAFAKIVESFEPSDKKTWAPAQLCLESLGKFRPTQPVIIGLIDRYLADAHSNLHISGIRAVGNLEVDGVRFSDRLIEIACDDSLFRTTLEAAALETTTLWSREFLDKSGKLQTENLARRSAAFSLSRTGFVREEQLDRVIRFLEQFDAVELMATESSEQPETAISRVKAGEREVARVFVSSLASAARRDSRWRDTITEKLRTRPELSVAFCVSYFDERRPDGGQLDEGFRRSVLETALRMTWANELWQIRAAAMIGDLRVDNDEAVLLLQNLAGHSSSGVAGTAVLALAQSAPKRAETRELVRFALQGERRGMREAGIRALGEIGPPAADDAPLLMPFLKLGYRGMLAANSLGKIGVGENGIREALEQAAASKDEFLSAAAQKALARITEVQARKERTESTGSSQ